MSVLVHLLKAVHMIEMELSSPLRLSGPVTNRIPMPTTRHPHPLSGWRLGLWLAVALIPALRPAACQAEPGANLEFTVKAAYIYNFIQFIDWPAHPGGAPAESVTLCVVGDSPFGVALAALANRQVKGQAIHVVQNQEPKLSSCQLVVIDRSAEAELSPVLTQLEGTSVLTVSDIPQFTHKGGAIGFVIVDGKVKVEINAHATQQAGLKVSAKLLEIAKIVP